MSLSPPSDFVAKILAPALQLWLRSQVEAVQELHLGLSGSNRQIFAGNIPSVSLSAAGAIYRGLHLGQVQLSGENIRLNVRQVLKGQPVGLMDPVPVKGLLELKQEDLQNSLSSPLLVEALGDLWRLLLPEGDIDRPGQVIWQEVTIAPATLTLTGIISSTEFSQNPIPLKLEMGLKLPQPNLLHLDPVHIETDLPGIAPKSLTIDLGSEVAIQELRLEPGQISITGATTILP